MSSKNAFYKMKMMMHFICLKINLSQNVIRQIKCIFPLAGTKPSLDFGPMSSLYSSVSTCGLQ